MRIAPHQSGAGLPAMTKPDEDEAIEAIGVYRHIFRRHEKFEPAWHRLWP
jgi:hypothetical protein